MRDRILKIAREEMSKFGYTRVTTDSLAKKAGISKRTLYQTFKSKKEILDALIDKYVFVQKDLIREALDDLSDCSTDTFIPKLKEIWDMIPKIVDHLSDVFFDDLQENLPEVWDKMQKFRVERLQSDFRRFLEIGKEKNIIKECINIDVIYYMHYFTVTNMMKPDVAIPMNLGKKEIIDQIFEVLIDGAATKEAKEEINKVFNG